MQTEIPENYNSIGCCYLGLQKFDDAYNSFQNSINYDSSYSYAYNNWAYGLTKECETIPDDDIKKEKLSEALRHINRAIQNKNDDVSYYSNRAFIEYELGSFSAVIDDYNDAIKISTNFKDLETILKLKISSQVELCYSNKQKISFLDLLNDLETIYNNNNNGSNKYLYQSLDVYYKIKDTNMNSDNLCLKLTIFEFIVKKLLSSLEVNDSNQEIYFYTSLSNLQKLLMDDTFRQPIFCSNHMNDPNEGRELYKTLIQSIDNNEIVHDVFF